MVVAIRLLRSIAREVVGEEKAREVWSRIDIIGDIAIIKKPLRTSLSLEDYRSIGAKLLERVKYVRSVWLAASPVEGEYRVRRELIHLAGDKRTVTVYREHGCSFLVDISKVFVTPRLGFEHYRVAKLVRPGEVIVNMFAGAGIFSIVIARIARPSKVYSIDINREAVELMKRNVEINSVKDVVVPIHGDAAEVVSRRLSGIADRVLMPLPVLAISYLGHALESLKDRGALHVYLHISYGKGEDPRDKASGIVLNEVERLGYSVENIQARVVRPVGPRTVQVVVDAGVLRC